MCIHTFKFAFAFELHGLSFFLKAPLCHSQYFRGFGVYVIRSFCSFDLLCVLAWHVVPFRKIYHFRSAGHNGRMLLH